MALLERWKLLCRFGILHAGKTAWKIQGHQNRDFAIWRYIGLS